MKIIRLFCAGGLSTGLLVKNMIQASEEMGFQADISAHGIGSLDTRGHEADIILLGPQIRYKLATAKELYPEKPVFVIESKMYGMLDGKAVIQEIMKVLK